ncbi:hypothetical protein A3197_17235 [Candidatus Thiodiazotropha endoloripes]|nr:hypothetical protein A3197_17235 [Candidatus Thiodiazotropha endoloripes]
MSKDIKEPKIVRKKKSKSTRKPSQVLYNLHKGTPQLLNARVTRQEIHLHVNGPGMLYGAVRLLTSLDMEDGASFHAWTRLAKTLKCTSYCGHHGKLDIPVELETSRIGTCIKFSVGPMSMYSTHLVLRSRSRSNTLKQTLDKAFGINRGRYSAYLIPEASTSHEDHDATIFQAGAQGGQDHHGN